MPVTYWNPAVIHTRPTAARALQCVGKRLLLALILVPISAPISLVPAQAQTVTRIVVSGDLATKATRDTAASDFALTLAPDLTLTLGDNHNLNKATICNETPCSEIDEYKALFAPTWGRLPGLHPAPGNHDYLANATDYQSYFGVPAYYSFDIPGWHIVSLNAELKNLTAARDWLAEQGWLKADLATVPKTTSVLAYWHEPLYSFSPEHTGETKVQPLWNILAAHGARTLVLNGHIHDYERYAPMNGITEIVVSAGGAPPTGSFVLRTLAPVVKDLGTHVALLMLVSDGSYHIDVYRLPSSGAAVLIDHA